MNKTEDEIFADAMKAWDKYKRKRALKALFETKSFAAELYDYNFIVRCFMWVKCLICLLLNRTGGSYLDPHTVCILAYDESQCIESTNWDACWVSSKLFSGWQVCLCSDGT